MSAVSAPLKGLTIKTGSVKRLANDYRSYTAEQRAFENKLQQLIEGHADQHEIKKQREFLEETETTVRDIHVRLQDAYAALQAHVALHRDSPDVMGTEELEKAVKLLEDTAAAVAPVDVANLGDTHHDEKQTRKRLKVVTYGSSRCKPKDELWIFARTIGEKIAQKGWHLISGGYHGTMEAVSEGASCVPGAIIEGVISPNVFIERGAHGNKYLTIETKTDSLQERIVHFTVVGDVFVVLPGNVGTLTELVMTWNVQTTAKLHYATPRPIFAARNPWQKTLQQLVDSLGISEPDLSHIIYFDTPDELIEMISQLEQVKLA